MGDSSLGPRPLLGALRRRRRPIVGAVAAVVACTGATALLGGFDTVETTTMPQWHAGEPLDLGPAEVTLLDHAVRDDVLADYLPDGAAAWLIVRARVEATDGETLTYPPEVVSPPEGAVLPDGEDAQPSADRVILLSDGTARPQLHPGLPEEVAYLWPVAEPGDVPAELQVEVLVSRLEFSASSQDDVWRTPQPAADVILPRNAQMPGTFEDTV